MNNIDLIKFPVTVSLENITLIWKHVNTSFPHRTNELTSLISNT